MYFQLATVIVLVCVLGIKTQCPKKCVCSSEHVDVLANCSNAQLVDIPRDDLDSETTSLDMSWNHLKILRNYTFLDRELYAIEDLDLSNNKYLSSIEPNAFVAMTNLKHLDLSFDDLAEISPQVFKPFKKRLEILILSHNPYLELPVGALQLPKLIALHLENNGLKSLPTDFFKHIKEVQLINIRGNKLSTLDSPDIENLRSLKFLYISNNMFKILPSGLLKLPKSLSELDLSGNPWECNCDQKKLVLAHERNLFVQNLTCETPEKYHNQSFTKALAADMFCETTTTTTTWATVTGSEGVEEHVAVTKVVREAFGLRKAANIQMRIIDDVADFSTQTATEVIVHAGVFQGTGEDNWFTNNQWWIICACTVAVMSVVALLLIKKVNSLRNRDTHEPVSVDEESNE